MSFYVTASDIRIGVHATVKVDVNYDVENEKSFLVTLTSFRGCPIGTPVEDGSAEVTAEPYPNLFVTNYGSLTPALGQPLEFIYRRWSTGEETYGCVLEVVAEVRRADGAKTLLQLAVAEFFLVVNAPPGGEPPAPREYVLEIQGATGGETSPRAGLYVLKQETMVVAIPGSGYVFDSWSLDGSEMSQNPITVSASQNHVLIPRFQSTTEPPDGNGGTVPQVNHTAAIVGSIIAGFITIVVASKYLKK